ncbi:MAG: hypothetical protein JXL84_20005 [Deltaproteobacteria bacterium]|nr:hypothetical protein [Deltaproteobacteria bacterium]
MEKRRQVEMALCIFELTIGKALDLPESVQTGVRMIYDRQAEKREFRLLDSQIPPHLHDRIVSWLEHNTEADDILWGIPGNRLDADRFRPLPFVELSM